MSGWAEAGQSPATFWGQTPASFDAVITGIRRRMQREAESDLFRAYTTASFNAAASAGKLKSFAHYKKSLNRPSGPQSSQEMLDAFRQIQAGGAPMTIRRIERTPT